MKTEVEKLKGNKVKLKVQVPAQVLDGAVKKTYKDLSQRLFVPGFRKGKIPKPVIDAQVGADAVIAKAAETIITSRYPEALVSSGVDPVEQPEVNVVTAELGKDLVFEADVEVKPEAKLGKYKNVEVVVPDADITDKDIDEQIDILRQRFARLEVVEDRNVGEGDYVLVDFSGKIDGAAFDGSSATDYMVEIGSGQLQKDLEKGMVGAAKGETRELEVSIPEDFHNKQIAGKQAAFTVTAKEIKQKILPATDDEFVQEVTEHDTLAGLRDEMRAKLEVLKMAQAKVVAQSKLLDVLIDGAEVDVPDKLLDMEMDGMMVEFQQNLQQRGSTLEDYLKATKSTAEKMRDEYKDEAAKRIKRELIIIAVAKAEKIEVDRPQIDEEIREIAKALEKPLVEVQQTIARKGSLPELHASLLRRKTIDWLLDNSKARSEAGKVIDLKPPAPPKPLEQDATDSGKKVAEVEVPEAPPVAEAVSGEGQASE